MRSVTSADNSAIITSDETFSGSADAKQHTTDGSGSATIVYAANDEIITTVPGSASAGDAAAPTQEEVSLVPATEEPSAADSAVVAAAPEAHSDIADSDAGGEGNFCYGKIEILLLLLLFQKKYSLFIYAVVLFYFIFLFYFDAFFSFRRREC